MGSDRNSGYSRSAQRVRLVAASDEIATVDGVDVLFVGPLDLSVNLGHPAQFDHPEVVATFEHVVAACERHGKSAGIPTKDGFVSQHKQMGFRFVVFGSDSSAVISGMESYLSQLRD